MSESLETIDSVLASLSSLSHTHTYRWLVTDVMFQLTDWFVIVFDVSTMIAAKPHKLLFRFSKHYLLRKDVITDELKDAVGGCI